MNQSAQATLRVAEVPAGRHKVEVVYRDRALLAGVVLSGLGLLACAGLWRHAGRAGGG